MNYFHSVLYFLSVFVWTQSLWGWCRWCWNT